MVGLGVIIALPSVVLMMIFGQTRIPVHDVARRPAAGKACRRCTRSSIPRRPDLDHRHRGVAVRGLFPGLGAGRYLQCGTLFAFFTVAIGVMVPAQDQNRTARARSATPLVLGSSALPGAACCCSFSMGWNPDHQVLHLGRDRTGRVLLCAPPQPMAPGNEHLLHAHTHRSRGCRREPLLYRGPWTPVRDGSAMKARPAGFLLLPEHHGPAIQLNLPA